MPLFESLFWIIFIAILWIAISQVGKFAQKNKVTKSEPKDEDKRFISVETVDQPAYCPFCNTKISQPSKRPCLRCHTGVICPTCRKCTNVDQHRGL